MAPSALPCMILLSGVSLSGRTIVNTSICPLLAFLVSRYKLYLKALGMWVNSRKGNIRSKVVNYLNIFKTYFQIAFQNLHHQYKLVPTEYFLETILILGTEDSLKKPKKTTLQKRQRRKQTFKCFQLCQERQAKLRVWSLIPHKGLPKPIWVSSSSSAGAGGSHILRGQRSLLGSREPSPP